MLVDSVVVVVVVDVVVAVTSATNNRDNNKPLFQTANPVLPLPLGNCCIMSCILLLLLLLLLLYRLVVGMGNSMYRWGNAIQTWL